jgi:hypothetical protein
MIQTIFGSPVVILESNNTKELVSDEIYNEIVDYLMSPDNKLVEHTYARGGKVFSTDVNFAMNKDRIESLDTLLNFLKEKGLTYSYLYSDKPIKDLKFHNMWINLTFQGCEIKNHYDSYDDTKEKSLIILFYPKAPKGGSNLVFIHNSKYGEWASERPEEDQVKINIEDGNIVIIDNFILHAVDQHNLLEPRMCIAFEFTLETD